MMQIMFIINIKEIVLWDAYNFDFLTILIFNNILIWINLNCLVFKNNQIHNFNVYACSCKSNKE